MLCRAGMLKQGIKSHGWSKLNLALVIILGVILLNLLLHIRRQNELHSAVQQERFPLTRSEVVIPSPRDLGNVGPTPLQHPIQAATFPPPASDERDQGWYQRVEDIPEGAAAWVTFVNGDEKYREIMLNWALHLRELHVPHLVVAFDDIAAHNCAEEGIPYIRHVETLVSGDFRGDFLKFRKMGSNKPLIVLQLLQKHKLGTVIISDVDTAWMRNPVEFLTRHPSADVLISTDCLSHWVEAVFDPDHPKARHYNRCGHMPAATFGRAFNTGVIIFRNRPITLKLLQAWREFLTDPERAYTHSQSGTDLAITDQLAFNMLLQRNITEIRPTAEDWRVLWAFDNQLRLMALPSLLFTNGHVFFYQHLPQKHKVQAYVVHTTFQRHHTSGKRARLREEGLWLVDPPEYFSQGEFMAYVNDVEEYVEALNEKATHPLPDLYKHFHAMSYQLAAMRDAFAIARALNRTLDWYASVLQACRVDSSDLTNPFVCPLDMLLNPADLDNSSLPYRMASFLTDRRTPLQILRDEEPVHIDSNPAWVTNMRKHNVGAGNYLLAGTGANEIASVLNSMSGVRILTFHGLRPGSFGGYDDSKENTDFDQVMTKIFSVQNKWCCTGEQPIDVKWITWWYILPTPLATGTTADWKIPVYTKPEHCDKIRDGEAGQLNVGFLKQQNHPCNFLSKDIQLPASLLQVLPSKAQLIAV